MQALSIFDYLMPRFKIDKLIRLIELFAGVGSQAMALRDIGADFEHYKVVELDKYAIRSYNAIHGTNFQASDICNVHANDLEIDEKERYCYIVTYSFPCQDLSIAGKREGMAKGSGTRSSLLWEVERIIGECYRDGCLPQVLLMENVPEVVGQKNIKDFMQWYATLEALGYQSYYKVLNAKDYGIPQSRDRCFMVSVLGNYSYSFPPAIPLNLRLKDVLEDEVDEKYYVPPSRINYLKVDNIAKTVRSGGRGSFDRHSWDIVVVGETDYGNFKSMNRVYDDGGISPTLCSMRGGNIQPKVLQRKHGYNKGGEKELCPSITSSAFCGNNFVKETSVVRKFTPLECWRLMGFTDDDFYKAKAVNSDSQLYKQAGLSIVKQVLMAIFKEMIG